MCAFTSSLAPWMRFGLWFRRHPALGRCHPGQACPSGPTKHAGRVAGTLRSRPGREWRERDPRLWPQGVVRASVRRGGGHRVAGTAAVGPWDAQPRELTRPGSQVEGDAHVARGRWGP